MKKFLLFFLCSMLLTSCSNAKDNKTSESKISESELDKQIIQTRIIAQASSIESASYLYKSAYKFADQYSEVNDHLFLYALSELDSLFGTYQMGNLNYEQDIKTYKLVSDDTIDSICIINKYLIKYQPKVKNTKLAQRYTETLNRTLKLQDTYVKLLTDAPNLINGSQCLKLK